MSEKQKIYVVPRKDTKVHDPESRDFLPEDGREVTISTYWSRRINQGDVTVSQPAKPIKSTVKSK